LPVFALLGLLAHEASAQDHPGAGSETGVPTEEAGPPGDAGAPLDDTGDAGAADAAAELDADAELADAGQDLDAELPAPDAMSPDASRAADAAAIVPLPPAAGQAAAPSLAESAPAAPVTVTVRGQLSAREQLQQSSSAVTVVDLRQAKKRSSDLGEVLARVAGVSIRRYGGLGSEFRFSLNGLYDEQIRLFIDSVPLERIYALGVANVPVNLIQDVEIYRGVVPLRLATDALGGALNLVTAAKYETALQASYQLGSFGTHRATIAARYRHEPTGIIAGVDAFFDDADNDYQIDVEIPDERGRLSTARVRRFHDGYRAYGVFAEVGVVDKPWARKLLARGFTNAYTKELQHNVVMTVPYGEPHYGKAIEGGLVIYQNTFRHRYDLDLVAVYSHATTDFVDKGAWVYDWRGDQIRERRVHGEIDSKPRDQTIWDQTGFARATFDARLVPGHMLTFAASPDYAARTGDERIQLDPDSRDPLSAERRLFKLTAGLSHTLSARPLADAPAPEERRREHYRWENVLFVKGYLYRTDSEEPLPGNIFRKRDQERNLTGVGDTLRVILCDHFLLAKASYEYATRLPAAYEVFGDGVLVVANLELKPEVGHNANLGPQLDLRDTRTGDFWLDVNAFLRDSRDQIVRLGNDRFFAYQNVYRARALGIENSAKWTSPGRYATLDAQLTYVDQRNISDKGTFGDFNGDRIPNRPWLFASWGGFLRFDSVFLKRDRIEPFYQGRYVHEFYRGWESVGLREYKETVPSQVSHGVGVTYAVHVGRGTLYGTFDVQNVTDADLFDYFGVQRPGRGYYFKLVGEL
jgi:vitamin B12 transporter